MKISILDKCGTARALLDHGTELYLDAAEGVDAYFVEQALMMVPEDAPVINTSKKIKGFLLQDPARRAVYNEINLVNRPTISMLYSLFNGSGFADWIEVSHSERFMTGEVGRKAGFIVGTALKPDISPFEAISGLPRLRDILHDLDYHGEVLVGVGENYEITSILFGHFYGHFGLFCEMSKCSVEEMLEFCLGEIAECRVEDMCGIGNLISQYPYPALVLGTKSIRSPKHAEKHLWRMHHPQGSEVVLLTVRGISMIEAKYRIKRTLTNLSSQDPELQFRTDYGVGCNFVLCQKKYIEKKQHPKKLQQSSGEGKTGESQG